MCGGRDRAEGGGRGAWCGRGGYGGYWRGRVCGGGGAGGWSRRGIGTGGGGWCRHCVEDDGWGDDNEDCR